MIFFLRSTTSSSDYIPEIEKVRSGDLSPKRQIYLKGDRALDLCTGTGSVAVELAKRVGEDGLVSRS